MSYKFKLRFPKSKITHYASEYDYQNENVMCNVIAPKIQRQKFLTKEDFIFLCRWKTPRITPHVNKNDESYIKEVTKISLTTSNPQLSIEVLTLLKGVSWPVASVMLHFGKNNEYPILDYRALWSLGFNSPPAYNFDFWISYTNFCKELSKEMKVDMRTLDRALWQYSKENQKRGKRK